MIFWDIDLVLSEDIDLVLSEENEQNENLCIVLSWLSSWKLNNIEMINQKFHSFIAYQNQRSIQMNGT